MSTHLDLRKPLLMGLDSSTPFSLHLGERKTSQTGSGRELAIKTDCLDTDQILSMIIKVTR